jgi:hypothetical protein
MMRSSPLVIPRSPTLGFWRTVSLVLPGSLCLASAARGQTDYYNTDRGRPIRIEDAYPTERYSFDVHLAPVTLQRSPGGVYTWRLNPEVAYGVFPRTQIEVGMPLTYVDLGASARSFGLAGIDLSALYNFNVETESMPALGVRGTVVLPVGSLAPDRAYASVQGMATRTYRWARFHVNGQYTAGSRPSSAQPMASAGEDVSRWLAGIAVDRTFPLRALLLTAETFAEQPLEPDASVAWRAGAGLRYQVDPFFAVDAGVGKRLTGEDTGWFITVGLARVFGIRSLFPVR